MDVPVTINRLALAYDHLDTNVAHIRRLRDRLIAGILGRVPGVQLTGHPTERLPGSASFCFEGVEGESILLSLDRQGIMASSGSACTAGSLEPSHVIKALGLPPELSSGSLRLTVGLSNTEEQIDRVLEIIPDAIQYLRSLGTNW